MFTSVNAFLETWKDEVRLTQGYMDTLTDASLQQEITADNWNLGQIAWHLTVFPKVMFQATGLEFEGPNAEEKMPESASEIAKAYRSVTGAVTAAIQAQWSDEDLPAVKSIFGHGFPIGAALTMLIRHQIHHRGQMTVLMRQAGLVVPPVYGPTKERSAHA